MRGIRTDFVDAAAHNRFSWTVFVNQSGLRGVFAPELDGRSGQLLAANHVGVGLSCQGLGRQQVT